MAILDRLDELDERVFHARSNAAELSARAVRQWWVLAVSALISVVAITFLPRGVGAFPAASAIVSAFVAGYRFNERRRQLGKPDDVVPAD